MIKKAIFILLLILLIIVVGVSISNPKPQISLNGDSTVKLQLSDSYEELGATATLRGKDISDKIEITADVDTSKIGSYIVKYMVPDKKSAQIERMVEVYDSVSPVITLKDQSEVSIYVGDEYKEPGYLAEDNYDGDITDKVKVEGNVDTTKVGDYTLQYTVEDSSGNPYQITRTVKVKEKQAISTSSNTNTNTATNQNGASLPILMYHFFYNEAAGETGADSNWMEISAFEEQMKYLSDNNYYYPSWSEVYDFVKGNKTLPSKSVVVTIDDGDESFFNLAISVLKKYNVTATSFVVTSWTSADRIAGNKSSILNFQSHSHDMHKAGSDGKGAFLTLGHDKAYADLNTSKNILNTSDAFCYPFGHNSDFTRSMLAEAGYKVAVTTQSGRATSGMDNLKLPRVRMSKGDSLNSFINKVK